MSSTEAAAGRHCWRVAAQGLAHGQEGRGVVQEPGGLEDGHQQGTANHPPGCQPGPCGHGDKDFEEIDLVAVGPPGIWAIEVKSWRGIILE